MKGFSTLFYFMYVFQISSQENITSTNFALVFQYVPFFHVRIKWLSRNFEKTNDVAKRQWEIESVQYLNFWLHLLEQIKTDQQWTYFFSYILLKLSAEPPEIVKLWFSRYRKSLAQYFYNFENGSSTITSKSLSKNLSNSRELAFWFTFRLEDKNTSVCFHYWDSLTAFLT